MSILQSLWAALAGSVQGSPQPGFLLRMIGSHSGCRAFAALQMPGVLKCVVLGVPKNTLVGLDIPLNSSAFQCFVAEIEGLGDGQAGIVLTLNDAEYEDLFVRLSEDIINASAGESNPTKAVGAIFRTIERWRRFVQRMGLGTLSDEEVQGLIGELAVLARQISGHGEKASVMAWIGPDDAIHDFAIGAVELEVKSNQGNPAGGIWVNDLAQLQPDPAKSLYLIVPFISLAVKEGLSLPGFIGRLKMLLKADPLAVELFTMKLASLGYLDSLADRYTRIYTVREISSYRVSDGFPTIEPSSVPPAVEKVKYRLRLASLEPWRVDSRAIIGLGSAPWGDP